VLVASGIHSGRTARDHLRARAAPGHVSLGRVEAVLEQVDLTHAAHRRVGEMLVLWACARDLFQSPGFGDTVDFDHIKRRHYQVHRDINPTGIVPAGPDLSGWLSPHGRETRTGRPFGDGTPPGPPPPGDIVPSARSPLPA